MTLETKKLSVEPYKGTRDFYPGDQFIQNYIFSVWRKVAQKYGYLEYNASILEETALYKAKSGEEIVGEQTYSFTDRGGRDVTIRPEMTPTVARMVAQKRKELNFPLRWFSMPNLFRYERPQRGRLREHWQLNCDIFGVDSIDADVEIISLAYDIMKEFGAKDEDFEIRVNSRDFLNFLLKDYLKFSDDQAYVLTKLLDKKNKISQADFREEVEKNLTNQNGITDKFIQIINSPFENLNSDILTSTQAQNLKSVIQKLENNLIPTLSSPGEGGRPAQNIVFDISVVRGFDYYTGTVFEVYDKSPENNRSLFGGGRYDDLVGIFDVEKVSGVGFGMGDVTIADFLETHQLTPEYKPATQLYICPFDSSFINNANELANYLRQQNINVAVDYTDRSVGKKVKTADKENIPFVLVLGEEEVKSGKYKVKSLKESKEHLVTKEEIVNLLKK